MLVGVAKLDFFFPENRSLKEKRRVLGTLKGKVEQRFQVTLSEVGHQDLWQRSEIGFAVAGSDRRTVASLLERLVAFIERLDCGQVIDRSVDILDF